MAHNRLKPRRRLTFDSLEGRLTLSAGMGMVAASHHAEIAHTDVKSLKATFTGRVTLSGSTYTSSNLKGTIGPAKFAGTAQVLTQGQALAGGYVNLSNSQGTLEFQLVPGNPVKVGKTVKQPVGLLAIEGTGAYASYIGATGNVTKFKLPAKGSGPATITATVRPDIGPPMNELGDPGD